MATGCRQSPLAERRFYVLAVDTCQRLLDVLVARALDLPIETLCADIVECWVENQDPAGVVVCMGDTLTHLGSQREVSELLDHVASTLAPGGLFITTFRNYVGQPLEGDQRFIAVRADDDRILTCYLEYLEDHVRVHDIVHVRAGHEWQRTVSSYDKLRLDPDWLAMESERRGLKIIIDRAARGMVTLAARSQDS